MDAHCISSAVSERTSRIAVVIPTYRAKKSILNVISNIGPEVARIFVVDDSCPDRTGEYVEQNCTDPRITVLRTPVNKGVGGATMVGYKAAAADGATVIVKIDADGQMDPTLIPFFVNPILAGQADYTKGNRFYNAASIRSMPKVRLIGNAALSIMAKVSSGYWNIFDPANGYTAIHAALVNVIPTEHVENRYFFETDILYYLGLLRAVVLDVPIFSYYGDEESNLRPRSVLLPFLLAHANRFARRVVLNYFLRDFSFASICLLAGLSLSIFGVVYGVANWLPHAWAGVPTATGTIVLTAISLIVGMQLILFFFSADIASVPKQPLHKLLQTKTVFPLEQFARNGASSSRRS